MEPIYTSIQVAEMLGLKPRTLINWRSQGQGPKYIKIGGLVRYEHSAIEAYIDEARKASA